jgi:uncharacterized membrane protein
MNKTRLEAFSDGVFAIIITIMVLELKAPMGTSWEVVKELWPEFSCYVLSFTYVGIYWNNHHHMMHTLKKINAGVMWANMHLLFWLSLVPFVTEWMGKNHFDKVTVAVYACLLIVVGMAYNLLNSAICKTYTEQTKLTTAISKSGIKGLWSAIIYAVAIPAALFVHPALAAALIAAVAIMWLIPSKAIEEALEEEHNLR